MAHAILAPSAAHRWLRCPGSVTYQAEPTTPKPAAEQGSRAHEAARLALQEEIPLAKAVELAMREEESAEALEYLPSYIEAAQQLMTMAQKYGVEEVVDISAITGEPGAYGTIDFWALSGDVLYVLDLKYGTGDLVEVLDSELGLANPQMLIYAGGLLRRFPHVTAVHLEVHQPRRQHYAQHVLTDAEVREQCERIRQAAERTRAPNPEFVPSERACRYCPGKRECRARFQVLERFARLEFNSITPHDVAEWLHLLPAARQACEDLEAMAREMLARDPTAVPGWKLVEGRSVAQWAPGKEAEIERLLGDAAWRVERKLITLTEAKKRLGADLTRALDGLTIKKSGPPVLAPASDPRPALRLDAGSEFHNEVN